MRLHRSLLTTRLLLLLIAVIPAAAQDFEFFPEADAYVKLTSNLRARMQVKQDREAGAPTQAQIGPSLDFYVKPLIKLKEVTAFDLDDSKTRPLVLSVGYLYLPSSDAPASNRMQLEGTFHFPIKVGKLLLSDRNRFALDWTTKGFNWRYRNRLELEKTLTIHSYHPAPYVSVEPYYESQYSKWSTTALYAGCLLPVGKHVEFNPYYEHENNTGKKPNQQIDAFGLILNLYFER